MSGVVFQGNSELSLDAKGRLSLPARHRPQLDALCAGQLTLTKHPAGCLALFPRPTWERFRDKIVALPMSADGIKRLYLGSAFDVDLDGSSRILVSLELRKWAALDKDIVLMGMGHCFEIWDAARYQAHEQAELAKPLPATLENFSFSEL